MRALLPVLAVLLSACNVPFQEPVDFPRHRPLEARIAPGDHSSRQVRFHLSRPAYVAVFEVVPGAGVTVLYPSRGSAGRRLRSGWHSPSAHAARSAWRYGSRGDGRPRYLYLLASDRPLRIEPFARSPSALRRALGPHAFAGHDPRRTMAMLDDLVLGAGFDQDWTRDVYMEWPEQRRREERVAYRCSTGQVIRVPSTATRADVQRICGRFKPSTPAQAPRRDTTTVRKPSNRRPEARPEAEAPRRPAARPSTATPRQRSSDGNEVEREKLDQRRPRAAPVPPPEARRPESRPADAAPLAVVADGPVAAPSPAPAAREGRGRPGPLPAPAAGLEERPAWSTRPDPRPEAEAPAPSRQQAPEPEAPGRVEEPVGGVSPGDPTAAEPTRPRGSEH